jgi:hypothetical protein
MIRVLAFMVRRRDLTRDQFRNHYERTHVPTALPILTGTSHYVRHHIREELFGMPDFDCMTAFEYPDAASMRAVFAKSEGPEGATVRADEQRFMDKPANFFFAVEEAGGWGDPLSDDPLMRVLVCVRRRPAATQGGFRAEFAVEDLDRLRAALVEPRWARVAYAVPGTPRERSFDVVVLAGAVGAGDLLGWCRAQEAGGSQVLALRVSSHGTHVPHPGTA